MSRTPKTNTLSKLLWLVALCVSLLVLLGGVGTLLLSQDEKRIDAMKDGRYLLVSLADGKIEGKQLDKISDAPAPEALPETSPETPAGGAGEQPEEVPTGQTTEPPSSEASGETSSVANAPETTPPAEDPVVATQEPATTESTMPAARIEPRDVPEVTETPLAPLTETAPVAAEPVITPTPDVIGHVANKKPEPVQEMARSVESLPPAPLSELVEKTEKGLELPKVNEANGNTPWQYYSKPFTPKKNAPIISIIITGLGHSRTASDAAVKLPPEMTLSFSPYAKDTPIWAKNARSLGHEVMVELPMEPRDYPATDPGPYALLSIMTAEENISRLHWVISRFAGFTGVLAPMEEKFTSTAKTVKAITDEIAKRGLIFVYSNPEATLANSTLATKADLIIDNELNSESILSQLLKLEAIAKKDGRAVGVAHSYPIVLILLNEWSKGLGAKGISLAPLSASIK